jgi:enamine deaminase RidA (YjgF/YER057c/UK114 family)
MVDRSTAFVSSIPCIRVAPPAYFETTLGMVQVEKHLEELAITLPPPVGAKANYTPCQKVGNLLYLSGHLPLTVDGALLTGRIGPGGKSVDDGYEAAKQVGLNLIATLKDQLGDLDRVAQVVKLFGVVQSADDFKEQHLVMNGCSDVLVQVFGEERGMHARTAIGTNALPMDISVEVEAIVLIKDP